MTFHDSSRVDYFGALAGKHRELRFREALIQAFYAGMKHQPPATFGGALSGAGRRSSEPAPVSPPLRCPG